VGRTNATTPGETLEMLEMLAGLYHIPHHFPRFQLLNFPLISTALKLVSDLSNPGETKL
jgi:hypothetical protein